MGAQVLATGERKVLIDPGFDAQYSPSGHLVYGKGASLFAVPFDVDRLEVTGTPVKLLDDVETEVANGFANFSAVIDRHAGVHARAVSGRKAAGVDGSVGCGDATPYGSTAVREPPSVAGWPAPCRERHQGDQQNIWVYQLANEMFRPVTFEGLNSAPLWTPDGLRLTYSSRRDDAQHLFWQPLDGSSPAESLISSKNNLTAGGWTADVRSLVYMDDPPTNNSEMRVLTLAGRGSEMVSGIPLRSSSPNLSPDGRWLAFVTSGQGGRPTISVQPFPGPGLRRQIVEGGDQPVWSRDGRELFFRSRRGAAPRGTGDRGPADEGIFALAFDSARGEASAQPVQLFRGRFASGSWAVRMYDVTPDAKRFIVVMSGDEEYVPREPERRHERRRRTAAARASQVGRVLRPSLAREARELRPDAPKRLRRGGGSDPAGASLVLQPGGRRHNQAFSPITRPLC